MKARLLDLSLSFDGKQRLTIELDGDFRTEFEELHDKPVSVSVKQYRAKRSLDANGYLWALIGKIADALRESKDEIYFDMLKAYGQGGAVSVEEKYAEDFNAETSQSMAMFGGTGLGKTHLSSALAQAVLSRGFDVLYVSALDLFSAFEAERFGNGGSQLPLIDRFYRCDLLLIDDLGTEVSNQFTVSCLYNIINTRLNTRRPTVISTNVMQDELRRRYWDRITSRVLGNFTILPFKGTDIRRQKLSK